MTRTALASVVAFLRKPLFGTTVIPQDATVDPTLFPEDDYPVYCTKCGYHLRGLPDGKCPECGTSFERGSLLVRAYAGDGSGTRWQHCAARKWFGRLIVAGIVVPWLALLVVACWLYFDSVSPNPPSSAASDSRFRLLLMGLMTLYTAPLIGFVAALVIAAKAYPRGMRKRRRAIIAAIKQAGSNDEATCAGATEGTDPAPRTTKPPGPDSSTC